MRFAIRALGANILGSCEHLRLGYTDAMHASVHSSNYRSLHTYHSYRDILTTKNRLTQNHTTDTFLPLPTLPSYSQKA